MPLRLGRTLTPAKARAGRAGRACGRAGRTLAHWPATNSTTDVQGNSHEANACR